MYGVCTSARESLQVHGSKVQQTSVCKHMKERATVSVFISVSVKRTLWGVQLPLEAQTTQRYVVVPKCYWLFNMFVSTFMRAVAFSPSSCVQRHKFLWFLEHFCARLQMERTTKEQYCTAVSILSFVTLNGWNTGWKWQKKILVHHCHLQDTVLM